MRITTVRVDRTAHSVEEGVHEALGVECNEIIWSLAEPDELHRNAERRSIATTIPPFAVPSSFVSTTPVTATASVN